MISQKGLTPVNIIIIVILVIVILVGGYYFLNRKKPEVVDSNKPSVAPSVSLENSKVFQGQYIEFEYPGNWNPTQNELSPGSVSESVDLGIPGIDSDQELGLSGVAWENLKPDDAVSQENISIGGKEGFKWVRKGEDYVSYDYSTIGMNEEGSFTVHVTTNEENKELEKQLDDLVASIKFKN